MARDLYDNDVDCFWKAVHKMNSCNNVQANVIDGITGQENIADYWKEHFYKILNVNDYDHNLTADVSRKLQNVQHDSNMAVSAKIITEIVSKLECGKSAGPDGISAECFKFSNTKIHVLLSLLFSMCLSHGYLPSTLTKTTIVPIVKNKSGNLSDSNRPISQTVFMLSIAINRAEHVCATVIIKHNYMLMCNHKIVINIMLCLLNSTGHI